LKTATGTVLVAILFTGNAPSLPQRDAKGHLQPFDCGTLIPRRAHECDPSNFSKVLKHSKTVAVIVDANLYFDHPEADRKHAETIIRGWKRFRIITDPENTDLVFEVVQLSIPKDMGPLLPQERLPGAQIQVWPHGANPQTDDAVWMEMYSGKWTKSDAIAGALRLLWSDIQDCEKLPSK